MWVAMGVAVGGPSEASALATRGHVPAGGFEGVGEHAIVRPDGVAVDEASGEVYVSDHSSPHEQVERFKLDGKGGYEFVAAFNVKSPGEIAVDNSTNEADPSRGDVYVVGAEEEAAAPEEHNVLYKYDPASGTVVFKKTIFRAEKQELELEEIYGVAVDASGTVWVDWGEEGVISALTDAERSRWQPSLTKETLVEQRFGCRARPGFAVAPADTFFYVAHERMSDLGECGEEETSPVLIAKYDGSGQPVARGVDREASSGLAVDDRSGDVYIDNASSVAAYAESGSLIQRFGSGSLVGGGAVAVDAARGEAFVAEPGTGKVERFVGEEPGVPTVDSVTAQNLTDSSERLAAAIDPHGADTHYFFQYGTLSCATDVSTCTDVPAPPGGDLGSGFGDQGVTADLTALQPNTTYFYRVVAQNEDGTTESDQSRETFFTTLPSAEGVLADHREWELVSPPEKRGASVEPISREGALIQAAADGNSITWTASTPVTGEAEGNRAPEPVQVVSSRATAEWASQTIATPHNHGEGIDPGEATEYRFFSPDLSFALVQPQVPNEPLEDPPLAPGVVEKTMYRRSSATGDYEPVVTTANATAEVPFGGKLEFAGASPDLKRVVFTSEVPLVAGAGKTGLYEWESGASLKLVSMLPDGTTPAEEAELGDQGRDVRGAISRDGSRVFWTSGGEQGPLYMRDTVTGTTVQVNAAQGPKEPDEEERSEGLDEVHFQSASQDGSKVLFTDSWPLTRDSTLEPLEEEEVTEGEGARAAGRPQDLYEYDVETGGLSDLSVDQRVGENADVLGTIPGVSEDGSYVYFVANGVLASGAQPGDCPRTRPLLPHPEATCTLYVSEPDPEQPGQRLTRTIARLSYEDAGDWGGGNSPLFGDLGGVTSQVSTNGRYLAFMSERELTGYNNVDASPAASGAHDQEVFLYDAAEGRLVCASCNPDGHPPHGVYDTEKAGEGLGLTVDRPETWSGHWLAGSIPGWTLFELNNPVAEHQSRYLSNSGRLFFNSADPLVGQVTARTRAETIAGASQAVGVENVYEYEPDGEGSCTSQPGCVALVSSGTSSHESAFLDASEGGNDAFFVTAAQLSALDTDNSLDVYDARMCGTATTQSCLPVREPPAPSCTGELCKPAATQLPTPQPPATLTFSGPDNPSAQYSGPGTTLKPSGKPSSKPLTLKQKLALALKVCRKLKNKHKRAVCEARAKKKYRAALKVARRSTATRSGERPATRRPTAHEGHRA